MVTSICLIYNGLFLSISTFETPPTKETDTRYRQTRGGGKISNTSWWGYALKIDGRQARGGSLPGRPVRVEDDSSLNWNRSQTQNDSGGKNQATFIAKKP
jgi:hypothetical protein